MIAEIGSHDPLPFLQKNIFEHYPNLSRKILPANGLKSSNYYSDLLRNIELSAWALRPPLLVTLLRAFPEVHIYGPAIQQILAEGPDRSHPGDMPYWVCRVGTRLPLIGRNYTRAAGIAFNRSFHQDGAEGKRLLRVFGPPGSGRTHTLKFFKYLEDVQPLMVGVVEIDFGDREIVTQAACNDAYLELFLARQMEKQVRRRRAELQASNNTVGEYPDLLALIKAESQAYGFKPLTDLQQRNRWAKELANDFVDKALYRLKPEPSWWVVVFDNCELAPTVSHEFIRRLVELAAGSTTDRPTTDRSTIESADAGQLRVILLGDNDNLLPANLYREHVIEEDLSRQTFDENQVQQYFITFRERREIALDASQIQELTTKALDRAKQIHEELRSRSKAQRPLPPPRELWPQALATAVVELTNPMDALFEKKKGN